MSNASPDGSPPRAPRSVAGAFFAGSLAALGWAALAIDGSRSIGLSLAHGHGLPEALFRFFRFFTILTNVGITALMTVTALRQLAHRPLPSARVFNAALVYILVTCVTYEVMLRSRWSPQGVQIVTDLVFHDIVPALMLVFWLLFAPQTGLRWRDALWVLAYPAAYFTVTLGAGALGAGYPYHFFNVDKLGYRAVLVTAAVFLAIFYALGLVTTAVAMARARPPDSSVQK